MIYRHGGMPTKNHFHQGSAPMTIEAPRCRPTTGSSDQSSRYSSVRKRREEAGVLRLLERQPRLNSPTARPSVCIDAGEDNNLERSLDGAEWVGATSNT